MITSIVHKLIAILFVFFTLPLWPLLYIIVKFSSPGPFIFKQIRAGKNKKPFVIYKIRTMVWDAEKLKSKLMPANEADGPVFKIRNDPRYTPIGKILSQFAIDELPQLFNVLIGDMRLVGPRPLPMEEALKVSEKYQKRFSILPGITSTWVIYGGHKLSFKQWMDLDIEYVNGKSIITDLKVLSLTFAKIIAIASKSTKVYAQ